MIVFTSKSLPEFIRSSYDGGLDSLSQPEVMNSHLATTEANGHRYLLSQTDQQVERLIGVDETAWQRITILSQEAQSRFLERIDRVSREMADPPVYLPVPWSKYTFGNRLAFFALPRSQNDDALRWIAEKVEGDSFFWRLTDRQEQVRLEDFSRDDETVELVRAGYVEAWASVRTQFPAQAPADLLLQNSVTLERVTTDQVVRAHTYSEWLPLLNEQQLQVMDKATDQPLKVRGLAGSGKTLMLQLKALREVYRAAEDDHAESVAEYRVLFVTQSASMQRQGDIAFRRLDDRNLWSSIDVMPIFYLREILRGPIPEGIVVLGEDSLDGKEQQIRVINDVVEQVRTDSWQTLADGTSAWVASGVQAGKETPDRLRLAWALAREFSEVFDAYRLVRRSVKNYVDLPRESWMVPLLTLADRELAFTVYTAYVKRLVEEGQITVDQLMDDFRKYLESYEWNLRRVAEGYDLVLVDELHLFSDTERSVLHLLTRDADVSPPIIMALDPSQSAFTLLTGLSDDSLSRGAGVALTNEESINAFDLEKVHRFSQQVFGFVYYLHNSMPNMVELGHDWTFRLASTASGALPGTAVEIYFANVDAVANAVGMALDWASKAKSDERVALVGLGIRDLKSLKVELSRNSVSRSRFIVVESRDDIERLNYSGRALVVSASQYVAGLQFTKVVVVGGDSELSEFGSGASALRAAFSQLYLASSRAENELAVHTPSSGPLGDLLRKAAEAGHGNLHEV